MTMAKRVVTTMAATVLVKTVTRTLMTLLISQDSDIRRVIRDLQPLTSSLTRQRRMRDNGQEKRDMQEAKAPAQEERTRSIKKESKDVG